MILHEEFIKIAKLNGKKEAIIDTTRGSNVAFDRALIISLILKKKFEKLDPGYIGVMVPTSAGAYLSTIALLMSGRVPVMINYSTGAEQNCRYAQKKCNFKTIITSKALLEKIKCPILPEMILLEDLMTTIGLFDKIGAAIKSKGSAQKIISKCAPIQEDDNAVILFTSGSEKDPKAVQLTHKNISANVHASYTHLGLTPEDRMMSILPIFHVFGLQTNFWLPMTKGFTAITYSNPLEYKTVPKLIQKHKPTVITGTPIFFAGYIREASEGDFESLKRIIVGADKAPAWLREDFLSKHKIDLLEGYGTTETSPVISANQLEANKPGSIGKVLPGVRVQIRAMDSDQELKIGEEGRIFVSGDSVMKGYLGDEEETNAKLKDGWYDTGDIGVMDEDGFLWHKGRSKRFVKVGGEMVSLVRTEVFLEEILGNEVDCCVVEVPDQAKGAKLAAAVTKELDSADLIKKLGEKLPAIAIPKSFIYFEELPKMSSGKIDFRTVTKMVREKI
jgi:acyl-[acyl-carrier-protein]-phospholipid O-acyltransferase/long-chain-fatty-acid--[acyl-carrier-protein] ligase